MKILTWNVSGLRSFERKKDKYKIMSDMISKNKPDIICLNETKLNEDLDIELFKDYPYKYWSHSKIRKGYSGTAILSKIKAKKISKSPFDNEGRFIYTKFDNFSLICIYAPNSKSNLERLDYKINVWYRGLKSFLDSVKSEKIILTGDINTAHSLLDVENKKGGNRRSGWTPEERGMLAYIMKDYNLLDAFRTLNPFLVKYSFWDNKTRARQRNVGWRLDYFLVSKKIFDKVRSSDILTDVYGSDHAPIELILD